eukprot:TRINITY_DN5908_c0_g1_i1.p1 TRINITY_DN5908_c0_g1~~TRINITY_DN5908_c0_g1_i1.p1  ORF type:complete len:113 (+),score=17.19 TRINITY_DN5908_c0_g1_i1:498-836(+)
MQQQLLLAHPRPKALQVIMMPSLGECASFIVEVARANNTKNAQQKQRLINHTKANACSRQNALRMLQRLSLTSSQANTLLHSYGSIVRISDAAPSELVALGVYHEIAADILK